MGLKDDLKRMGRTLAGTYDMKKKRFKTTIVPVLLFMIATTIAFFYGIWRGFPSILLVSFTALAVSIVSAFHDSWMLNSLVAPTWIVFVIIATTDFIFGSYINFLIHAPTAIIGIIVSFRKDTSFFLMIGSSAMYAFFTYTLAKWVPSSGYACALAWCIPELEAFLIFLPGAIVSVYVTLFNFWRVDNKKVKLDCVGGICPL